MQLEVLALYRQCLRAARAKPAGARDGFVRLARDEFRQHAEIARRNTLRIEFLMRIGRRRLKQLSADSVTRVD